MSNSCKLTLSNPDHSHLIMMSSKMQKSDVLNVTYILSEELTKSFNSSF
jgi:hypothetical protein